MRLVTTPPERSAIMKVVYAFDAFAMLYFYSHTNKAPCCCCCRCREVMNRGKNGIRVWVIRRRRVTIVSECCIEKAQFICREENQDLSALEVHVVIVEGALSRLI